MISCYLFHVERVQVMHPAHYGRRKALLQMATAAGCIVGHVLLMAEERLTRNIFLNTRNRHTWAFGNPRSFEGT
jgi:hypothetical protein